MSGVGWVERVSGADKLQMVMSCVLKCLGSINKSPLYVNKKVVIVKS